MGLINVFGYCSKCGVLSNFYKIFTIKGKIFEFDGYCIDCYLNMKELGLIKKKEIKKENVRIR